MGTPEGWKATTLGAELERIEGGGTPSRKVEDYWNGDICWATIKDLTAPRLNDTEEHISESGLENSSSRVVPAGTVITATRMAVGRTVLFSRDVAINQDLKALFPKPSLDRDFLFYWMQATQPAVEAVATGSTVKGVRIETLRSLQMLLPPIAEQCKIVEIFDSVDEAIQATRAVIEQTRKVQLGMLEELLTRGIGHTRFKQTQIGEVPERWKVLSVGELFEVQLGKMLNAKARSGLNPKPYLGNANVQWDRIDLSEVATMDFTGHELVKFRLKSGDLLVCEGGQIGRAAIWTNELEECYYQKAIHRLRPLDGRILPEYMLQYLILNFEFRKVFSGETGATTIAHLPRERLLKIPVGVPPLREQIAIIEILSELRHSLGISEAAVATLQSIRYSLLRDLLHNPIRLLRLGYNKGTSCERLSYCSQSLDSQLTAAPVNVSSTHDP